MVNCKHPFILVALCCSCMYSLQLMGAANIKVSVNQTTSSDTSKGRNSFLKAEEYFNNSNFDSAIFHYLRSAGIYLNCKEFKNNIRTIIQVSNCYRKKLDFVNAIKYINLAEQSFKIYTPDDSSLLSDIYYMKALIFLQEQENYQAIDYFNKTISLRLRLNIKKDELLAKSYNNLGIAYYYLGEYDQAIEHYKKAYNEDLKLQRKDLNADINNIGSVFYIYGEYEKAIEYFEKTIDYNKNTGNIRDLNINYLNIGNAFKDRGKYYKALSYYQQSLYYFEKQEPSEILVKLLNNIGLVYNALGQNNQALKYFDQSLKIAVTLPNKSDLAMNYNNIGVVYDDLKNYPKALQYYQQAYNINKSLGYKDIACDFNNIGTVYFNINRLDEALSYYKKSLELVMAGGNNIDAGRTLRNIGDVYFKQKDFSKALTFYHKGLNFLIQDYTDTNIHSIPKISSSYSDLGLLELLKSKGIAFYDLYSQKSNRLQDLEQSLINYDLSIKLIDRIRAGYTTSDTKLFFAAKEKNIYSKSIEVALNLYDKTKNPLYQNQAFEYAEKGKVTLLNELIRENEAKKYANIPDSILSSEKELKSRIAYYKKAIYDEKRNLMPNEEKVRLWEKKVFALNEQLDHLTVSLEKNYPKYYQFKYDNKIFSPRDIQENLSNNDALIEYFIGEKQLYIFYITKTEFRIISQNIDSSLFRLIENMRFCLSDKELTKNAKERYLLFCNASCSLYKLLISPVGKYLKDKDLLIIPDGPLGYIPFEALISRLPQGDLTDYKNLAYLVREHAISYSYSSTLLMGTFKIKHKKARLNLSAFAPFFNRKFKLDENQLTGIYSHWKEFDALPGTKQEAVQIGKITRGNVYLDSFATEYRFKKIANKYRILHVATHGLIDDQNPMYSKLVFYLDKDSLEDGFLNTYELFNMELNAELAVLSACNTGTGELKQGEGIMTIARGFLYAGVPSIVMSLWKISDESSQIIMESFYKYLKKNYKKDRALQKAKLDYLESADNFTANPYFWAGCINIGSTKPIKFNNYLNYLWFLTVLIPAGLYFTLRKRCLFRKL